MIGHPHAAPVHQTDSLPHNGALYAPPGGYQSRPVCVRHADRRNLSKLTAWRGAVVPMGGDDGTLGPGPRVGRETCCLFRVPRYLAACTTANMHHPSVTARAQGSWCRRCRRAAVVLYHQLAIFTPCLARGTRALEPRALIPWFGSRGGGDKLPLNHTTVTLRLSWDSCVCLRWHRIDGGLGCLVQSHRGLPCRTCTACHKATSLIDTVFALASAHARSDSTLSEAGGVSSS
jgi:hypothetical protein